MKPVSRSRPAEGHLAGSWQDSRCHMARACKQGWASLWAKPVLTGATPTIVASSVHCQNLVTLAPLKTCLSLVLLLGGYLPLQSHQAAGTRFSTATVFPLHPFLQRALWQAESTSLSCESQMAGSPGDSRSSARVSSLCDLCRWECQMGTGKHGC